MLIQVRRTNLSLVSTPGDLLVDIKPVCKTLEDPFHVGKIKGETRIAAGLYRVELQTTGRLHDQYAARFPDFHRGMLHICDVPLFEGVMFHCGTTIEDTKGCPLVGTEAIAPANPDDPYTLAGSEAAYREFYPMIIPAFDRGEKVWAQFIDPEARR